MGVKKLINNHFISLPLLPYPYKPVLMDNTDLSFDLENTRAIVVPGTTENCLINCQGKWKYSVWF